MPRFDKLLVLDIDETLIHSTLERLDREPDFIVDPYFVYKRPGVDHFLESCLDWFEVGIWTSATRYYAEEIIKNLIGDISRISFLWCRERCTRRFDYSTREEYYLKDIKKLKRRGYNIEKIIIIEDSRQAVQRNYGNAIIVQEYRGEANDDELVKLLLYLEKLGTAENVRTIEKRYWRYKIAINLS